MKDRSDKSYKAASNKHRHDVCAVAPEAGHGRPATASNRHINRFKMAHSIGVAEYMRERAGEYGLNPNTMYVVGLLHDIGYLGGREGHEQRGADLLDAMGLGYFYHFAIEHHGENLYDVQKRCVGDEPLPFIVLLVEADMSVDARGYRVGFEKRLLDLERRYGSENIGLARENIQFVKEYQQAHGIAPYKQQKEQERDER